MNFSRFTRACAKFLGSPKAFVAAVVLIVLWAAAGPFLQFSTTWQLFINTGTTIFTFLSMFILQNSQEHGDRALHIKLDEIILAQKDADNKYVKAELKEDTIVDELDHLHEEQLKDQ